jgi:hypothetical protein
MGMAQKKRDNLIVGSYFRSLAVGASKWDAKAFKFFAR